jgi:AcrR family transcriptional regulator
VSVSRKACGARGASVIRAVLEATLDELARVGYTALTVENVAARAGVNKTTVYRRWPTRGELVEAALTAIAETAPLLQESGDVRLDLLAAARRMLAAMSSARGRGVLRMLLGGCAEPDLVALAFSIRKGFEAPARRMLERAALRGDLRSEIDPDLVLDAIGGWLIHTLFRERAAVAPERLAELVDLLLRGALVAAR